MAIARFLLAGFALLIAAAAVAQQPAGWGAYLGSGQNPLLDPFYIAPTNLPIQGAGGYTQASCTLGAGTNKVIVVAGQSLYANTANDSYAVSAPTKNLTFNAFDGNCYQTQYTMVGTFSCPSSASGVCGGTFCCGSALARMGDNLINNDGIAKVIIVGPIDQAMVGSLIANWSNPQVYPYLINNLAVVGRRLAAAGLAPTELVWEQGTSDGTAGTSQASYAASLQKIVAAFHSVWPGVPLLINTESFWNGSVNTGIQAAQASVVDNVTVFAGADTDTIGNSGRYSAGGNPPTHFNSTGSPQAAALLETAVLAH